MGIGAAVEPFVDFDVRIGMVGNKLVARPWPAASSCSEAAELLHHILAVDKRDELEGFFLVRDPFGITRVSKPRK